jgi:hypothetical protein
MHTNAPENAMNTTARVNGKISFFAGQAKTIMQPPVCPSPGADGI